MLSLKDLDLESLTDPVKYAERDLQECLQEIHATRKTLGQFTLRDSMEAVYGTEYTRQALGEDGGNDILISEMTALDDLREANGKDRRDIGGNRLPTKRINDMTSAEQTAAKRAIAEQVDVTEAAVVDSLKEYYVEAGNAYRAQKVAEDLASMLPEDRAEIIRLLQAQVSNDRRNYNV